MTSQHSFSEHATTPPFPVNICHQESDARIPTPLSIKRQDHVLFYSNGGIFTHPDTRSFLFPATFAEEQLPHSEVIYVGEHGGKAVFSLESPLRLGTSVPLRDALVTASAKTAQLICRGQHLLNWHKTTRFSGCCGTPTQLRTQEMAKECSNCKSVIYPTTSPAIIVLIERSGQLLLARSPHFRPGMYSTLAGFVDPGESLEAAVHRECQEEVGIRVKDVKYLGSQAWPFPSSLMIGFRATWSEGELKPQPGEIEDAKWFDASSLPDLPHRCSIARHLIDHYLEGASY